MDYNISFTVTYTKPKSHSQVTKQNFRLGGGRYWTQYVDILEQTEPVLTKFDKDQIKSFQCYNSSRPKRHCSRCPRI